MGLLRGKGWRVSTRESYAPACPGRHGPEAPRRAAAGRPRLSLGAARPRGVSVPEVAMGDLTSAAAVEQAMDEYDRLGRRAFLAEHGYSDARWWYVFRRGRPYESKAIAGRAYSIEHPDRTPLRETGRYTGGRSVVRKLRALGFEVRQVRSGSDPVDQVHRGETYDWDALGRLFGFRPRYLSTAGGMVPRPADNALMLITHPGGARSIDYGDYWDGEDLIYTGRGQRGSQQRSGANRDVGDNTRRLLVFEHVGPKQLLYLGRADCTEEWEAKAPDVDGRSRTVLRFSAPLPAPPSTDVREGSAAPRPGTPPSPLRPQAPSEGTLQALGAADSGGDTRAAGKGYARPLPTASGAQSLAEQRGLDRRRRGPCRGRPLGPRSLGGPGHL
jgi:hypothetical protein